MQAGIRELKDNLSQYIRCVEAGDRVAITSHGRIVAELVPPSTPNKQMQTLAASGVLRPAVESGDPLEGWPDIRLPAGTAAALIDDDRNEG